MIVYPCLRCSLPDLPIEVRRCPRCGEENFIPLNRTSSASDSPPEPINETTGFCDGSTEQIWEAKHINSGCSPNQSTHLKELQLQNCSNNPTVKNTALKDIPTAYDQAYSFNADDNDLCDSACVNVSASVSAHSEETKNRMNFSRQTKRKLENQSSIEMGVGRHIPEEFSQFKNQEGEIDFAGCNKCYRQFLAGYFSGFNMHQQSERDQKPFKCEKCLCGFSSRNLLNQHQEVHFRERLFKCDQCDRSFKYKNSLNKHILNIHSAKNNFV